MKNNKKFILAAGAAALGLVAATGVTSGFAWFAVNNTISLTGLAVTANADQSYLLIEEARDFTLATMQAAPATYSSASFSPASKDLMPVTIKTSVTPLTIDNLDDADSWEYRTSTNPAESQPTTNAATTVPEDDYAKYVARYDFTIGLATNTAACSLKVSNVTFTMADGAQAKKGLTIVLATETVGYKFAYGVAFAEQTLVNNLTEADAINLSAYVYIDGTNEEVTSNNRLLLDGTIGFTLSTAAVVA